MRKACFLTVSLLVIALVFVGCGGDGGDGGQQAYDDPSVTIKAKVGEEFVISLESNPTTGYSWDLAEPLDEDVVEMVGSQYIAEEGAEERVGAGGTEEWIFKGTGKGTATISLEYIRPWEEEEPAAEKKEFTVEVS